MHVRRAGLAKVCFGRYVGFKAATCLYEKSSLPHPKHVTICQMLCETAGGETHMDARRSHVDYPARLYKHNIGRLF